MCVLKIVSILEIKQGIGKMIMLGAGTQKSMEIDFFPLLGGRTFKYSVFGGIKIQSDLPLIIQKCINKVYLYLHMYL